MTKAENSRVAQSNEPSADRIAADLSANDIEVIRERRFGWEQATPKLLAAVFGVSVQRINAICAKRPALIDDPDNGGSDAGSYAAHIRDTACMGATL